MYCLITKVKTQNVLLCFILILHRKKSFLGWECHAVMQALSLLAEDQFLVAASFKKRI